MKRKWLMVMLMGVIIIVTACESSNKQVDTTDEPDAKVNEENDKREQEDDVELVVRGEDESNEKTNDHTEKSEKNTLVSSESTQITNGDEAVQFLKQHLKEGTNDDISFGTDGVLETDQKGSYYTVQLVDIPLRVSGKTGNLGYYKVYQDGTYERFQLNDSLNDNETSVLNKEVYLKKLRDIEKEMEELRTNSKATTTLEMEEEEAYLFQIWDGALNEIYGILKEQLSPKQMDQLREEQRNWIKQRDEIAKESSLKYKGGSMESLEYVATQASVTKERCFELVENYLK